MEQVEGFSKITYKGKEIYYIDYSGLSKDKEKTIELIRHVTDVYEHLPKNSVLEIVKAENFLFDMSVLNIFKEEGAKTAPYEKKVAVIGVKSLPRAAYNFIVGLSRSNYKILDSLEQAKEWLVADKRIG